MSGHSPGSRAGSDQSGGPPSSNPGPGGHQVDLHVMYSAFRSQHQTPSVGESLQFLTFLEKSFFFLPIRVCHGVGRIGATTLSKKALYRTTLSIIASK